MGSQSLEIIRQGVWASITGGWFYDPHQNLFCNTIHLYIWLFLLCLPFSIYLYYPPASIGWVIYCSLVAAVFVFIKVLNHSLHHMYDTSECIIIQPPNDGQAPNTQVQPEEGIEMQMLRLGGTTTNASDNESITSLEDHKPNASTIDLKVDVHRKNSSESSVEISATSEKQAESSTATRKSDLCVVQPVDTPGPSKTRSHRRPKCSHKKENRTKSRRSQSNKSEQPPNSIVSKTEETAVANVDDGPFPKVSTRFQDSSHHWTASNVNNSRDFIKEWLCIDATEHPAESNQNKLSRQLSSDSRDNSELSVGPPSPKKKMSHRRRYGNLPDESYTKSAMALATGQSTNMRRNSNSTMSTIQLPLLNSTAQLVSHLRRHSNNADAGFFASVELGAYMLDKTDDPSENTENKPKNKETGVRRIKSAALEVGCPLPNVSNHPNSAETIGGLTTKNPNNAVIPPPSTILKRSPPLNLYPRGETGEGCSYPYLIYGSEIVYPIAEISDEMQTSQKETDPDSTGDSYSDSDDEKFKGFDWNAEQQPVTRSSDSDYENNGSRSPLLDRNNDIKVIRVKSQGDKKVYCLKHPTAKQIESSSDNTKPANVRLKKNHKETSSKNIECSKNIDNIPDPRDVPKAKLKNNLVEVLSHSSKDFGVEKTSLESKGIKEKYCKSSNVTVVNKPWDHKHYSNSSSSSIESEDKHTAEIKKSCNENCVDSFMVNVMDKKDSLTLDNAKNDETSSVYSFYWLFDETKKCEELAITPTNEIANVSTFNPDITEDDDADITAEDIANFPKSLGAIPKQMRNHLIRHRAATHKENRTKDGKRFKTQADVLIDAVEAQAALVHGLEYLFAATNANTVVMPNHNREERSRNPRQQSFRGDRENFHKTRKRSIEEVAQTTTNTLLPSSVPLLAAFLNARSDFPNIQVCLPDTNAGTSEVGEQRFRPLIDRNHRNRVRKLKRSTRQRNNSIPQNCIEYAERPAASDYSHAVNKIHIATSFDDTTDGAIHCFMDECGNWMSYTFDRNSVSKAQDIAADKDEKLKSNKIKPFEKTDSQETAAEGSCGSLDSEAYNSESISKSKQGDNGDQNSSYKGSNNPLTASGNTLAGSVVPIHTNNSNKRFYVFDGGTGSHVEQHRSPVAYVTDSLLEQIEFEQQSRMGLPSMHINFLMSQQRAQQQAHTEITSTNIANLMPSIGEADFEHFRSKLSKVLDNIAKSNQPKPKSYYIFKIFKCYELKISMDRLKLLALFDRNHTYWETLVSIMLATLVAVLGSVVLNTGFYRDIYAFWFCFIMAGSQYSLLKSVQPDSASPVHGFNKMVVFSRPVYFCLCTIVLCIIHSYILPPNHMRNKRDQADWKPLLIYGLEFNEQDILRLIQDIIAIFILFFPLAHSLGFFPQVNTFLMYLLEQIDMHIFGGNATNSLTAALYCVARSLAAIGLLYGFAYSGLVEGKKTHHQKHNVLFSTFCGLLVPIAYHLSRSASDYALIWNLIKKHLIPPEFYAVSAPVLSKEPNKAPANPLTEEKKISSESNIYKPNSIGSSASKINFSSETNISKQKQSQASSTSSLKIDPKGGDSINSNSSLKVDAPSEQGDKVNDGATNTKTQDADKTDIDEDIEDPLPKKLQDTVNGRLKNDMIVCSFLAVIVFGIHSTTVFTTLRPKLNLALWIIASILGWLLHYLLPQLRKQQPWLCLAGPVLKCHEHAQFEVTEPARLMYFEKLYVYLCFLERNLLYPTLVIAATTQDAPTIAAKYGDALGALIVCVCSLKCLRNAYSDTYSQYLIVIFAVLLFQKDFVMHSLSETFLIDYFLTAIIFNKVYEFLLKLQFVVTYIAPWQITWGSAFHAFAQPFSVPHSAMLFLQAAFSALLSSPLTPALGSAIFMTSYVRPVKFWERDYNTKRVDQSNTRLSSQLERNLGADDNNLNSIFYEHLTRSLQHYLCGDLILGRWGQVQQGDCFVLASDYLNCLVHIVEFGNGLVSFQLRGLEFRGTYCQQREVEAISEGPEESNDGVCSGWWCTGRILTPGAMFSLRWLAWQLASAKYVLEGYSVSDNSAVSMLQVFDFRKVLLTYYVKSIIYYTIQSSKLEEWLTSPALIEALKPLSERNFTDLDPIFNVNLDVDYDFRASGITKSRFCAIYQDWIVHCGQRRGGGWRRKAGSRDSPLVTLCFALSLVGRRALAAAQHLPASTVEFFLYGLHSLFKGDFRITCPRDEWVFTDMSLLHSVLAPAVRMALKLHQDHFMFPEEYCSNSALYSAIASHTSRLVICHEAAPAWRSNVLRGAPHLLALRHVMDEGSDDYKIIMLNKRHLGFRVIKLNRECVRGLWAGQQQELVYLRNRNPERGSIQNAKQALRNIINSSCDQPIGYPIYVSPLTTSYADTSEQLCSLLGGAVTVKAIKTKAIGLWRRIRRRCGEGCSSGDVAACEAGVAPPPAPPRQNALHHSRTSLAGTRGSLASAGKPTSSTFASLAGLLREHSHERNADETVYGSNHDTSEPSRKSEERLSGGGGSIARRERQMRARNSGKDSMRQGGGRNRLRRERARPASFRMLAAETLNDNNEYTDERQTSESNWEGRWREQPRRAASAKIASQRPLTPDSSIEDLTLGPGGVEYTLADGKVIAARGARQDVRDFKRYLSSDGTSKDLSKPSKEIRHERESYRELTGRYTEKPDVTPLKEAPTDPSNKETNPKRDSKKEKSKELKTKIKRSDSGPSESKASVSVGSKVLIVEPLGVYDCINLGRRIDVQWPSEHQRERGGRNYWGSWVPMAGMDGLVVHKWTPNHRDPKLRSHVDKSILLVQIDDKFVPIGENNVQDLGDEV